MMNNTYLFLFCADPAKDPVASGVLREALAIYQPHRSESVLLGGKGIWLKELPCGATLAFAETPDVPSYIYSQLSAELNTHFSDARLISVVNWHQGANAPQKIFCAHTTADVPQGLFAPATGTELSALLRALEAQRLAAGLAAWRVLPEASHWSGTMVGCVATQLLDVKAPVVDLEIGSADSEWASPLAQRTLASALGMVPMYRKPTLPQLLFVGGTHFELSLAEGFFASEFNLSHVLPNQWVVGGEYSGERGAANLHRAIESVCERVDGLIFHDGLKGAYKATVRQVASSRGLFCGNHRVLRDPARFRELSQKLPESKTCQMTQSY